MYCNTYIATYVYTYVIIIRILILLCFSYYDLEVVSDESVNKFLSKIVEKIIIDLSQSYCLVVDEVCDSILTHTSTCDVLQDGHSLSSLLCGCVASYYYLHHTTVRMFKERLTSASNVEDLMAILSVSKI